MSDEWKYDVEEIVRSQYDAEVCEKPLSANLNLEDGLNTDEKMAYFNRVLANIFLYENERSRPLFDRTDPEKLAFEKRFIEANNELQEQRREAFMNDPTVGRPDPWAIKNND